MADIISFIPRERNESARRDGEPAAVIIFPGVRYERAGREDACSSESPQNGERSGRKGRRRRSS